MPLYLVQDEDGPTYVFAVSWQDALWAWQNYIRKQNEVPGEDYGEPDDPQGIQLVCETRECLITTAALSTLPHSHQAAQSLQTVEEHHQPPTAREEDPPAPGKF